MIAPIDRHTQSHMEYASEAAFVRAFVSSLTAQPEFSTAEILHEFPSRHGRADVVSVSVTGQVSAFEAKLTKWRDALHQAYRNTSFAHRSYVVLPLAAASRASGYLGEFESRRVGLCTIAAGQVVVIHHAPETEPLQPWVAADAIEQAGRSRASA